MLAILRQFIARLKTERDPAWEAWDEVGDRFRLPREWIHCAHCGAYAWRLPPHGLDPCPLVVEITESAGLKLDAERSTAIRSGVQIEELSRLLKLQIEGEDDE